MRKLITGTLLALDGVVGSPHLWASPYFDDAARAAGQEQLERSHAMLMGRKTYEIFSGMWPTQEGPYADKVNGIRKYVFSSTLERAEWSNATIVRDDPVTAVAKLKEEGDDDLIIYGFGQLGEALLRHGLVDELRVWVHPTFVGDGTLFFRPGQSAKLEHVETVTLETGVVMLAYRPAGGRGPVGRQKGSFVVWVPEGGARARKRAGERDFVAAPCYDFGPQPSSGDTDRPERGNHRVGACPARRRGESPPSPAA